MVANRQDAWTKEEDNYLAEVVLKSINEGSTQLMAFKVVAQALSRTAAACGYRWNSFVRKYYKEEIEQAKNSSKNNSSTKNVVGTEEVPEAKEETKSEKTNPELSFDSVFKFLESLKSKLDSHNPLKEIQALEKKVLKFKQENDQLKIEKQQLVEKLNELENEYAHLFEFLDQKRKLVSVKKE